MSKRHFVKNIVSHLCAALPHHLQEVKKDIKKNVRSILTRGFSKLDLVPREEFDVQTKVLQRTRKKLEEIETFLKKREPHE
ncbi:MAG: hypothetical protein A3E83_07085 [Gammaproteobacteria bacterium RIFCSPHIGHO2_12_FULL_41_20]|nr:MAG: hypothetical protein A3E83_07085 [Gammaproteobacteria bacterium RIFCSPHIGHO2_12_FULL_41_20]